MRGMSQLVGALDRTVRGGNLLDQGGPGARQPHDEDGTGSGGATSLIVQEQLAGADLLLALRIELEDLRTVTAQRFRALPRVIPEGGGVLAPKVLPRAKHRW